MKEYFILDQRLGILVPEIAEEWDEISKHTQQEIIFNWEQIRGSIPDRIAELETEINQKQAQLANETNFPLSCQLNNEIAELASIINDLWILFRMNQNISAKTHH